MTRQLQNKLWFRSKTRRISLKCVMKCLCYSQVNCGVALNHDIIIATILSGRATPRKMTSNRAVYLSTARTCIPRSFGIGYCRSHNRESSRALGVFHHKTDLSLVRAVHSSSSLRTFGFTGKTITATPTNTVCTRTRTWHICAVSTVPIARMHPTAFLDWKQSLLPVSHYKRAGSYSYRCSLVLHQQSRRLKASLSLFEASNVYIQRWITHTDCHFLSFYAQVKRRVE